MKIELLGTGGYFANARRHTACVLLPEWGIVFDGGSGLFRLPARCSVPDIDLFLTHAHLDHIAGLPCLLIPVLTGQFQNVVVHGTPHTLESVANHLFATSVFPVSMPFACREIPPSGNREVRQGVVVRWQALPSHPGGSMAYRVEVDSATETTSMAYVTDTSLDGSYTDFIQDVDLLIHECYFDDARANLAARTGHSCASEVARLAAEANVGQLVVVHLDPTLDVDDPIGLPGMQSLFPQTQIGCDGMHIDVCGSGAT